MCKGKLSRKDKMDAVMVCEKVVIEEIQPFKLFQDEVDILLEICSQIAG